MVGRKEHLAHPLVGAEPLGFAEIGLGGPVEISPTRGFRDDGMVNLRHSSVVTRDAVADAERAVVEQVPLHPVGEELAEFGVGAAAGIDVGRRVCRVHLGVELAGVRMLLDQGVDGDFLIPGEELEPGAVAGAAA